MKTLEYFYEEHVVPVVEVLQEFSFKTVICLLDVMLVAVLWITVLIWIIPFKIIKRIKDKK